MNLCFPIESEKGLDSLVYSHFGSAPCFIVVNTETKTIETINNQDLGHQHGMCSPIQALNGKKVDAIVVGGIGAGAINKLNAMGIQVYRACEDSVKTNLDLFESDALPKISLNGACREHGGCAH
jgi:ArsR family transcriptional regulator